MGESFGYLHPRLDACEADRGEEKKWTGWHRLETDLGPLSPEPNERAGCE